MSRKIKFRIWCETCNAFVPTLQIFPDDNGGMKMFCSMHPPVISMPLQQFTGLHDKNGAEIYEGDIVADYDADGIHVVEYYEDCFCLVRYSWAEARDLKKRSPSESEWWDTLEVIGNIHENPDLLI